MRHATERPGLAPARRCLALLTVLGCLMAQAGRAADDGVELIEGDAVAIDGDTLWLRSGYTDVTKVRLFAIDAPERDDWPYGAYATAVLDELLAGNWLECRVIETDRHGRKVARCDVKFRPEGDAFANLGIALVRAGVAVANRRWGHFDAEGAWRQGEFVHQAAGALEHVEREARAAGRGLWGQWRTGYVKPKF